MSIKMLLSGVVIFLFTQGCTIYHKVDVAPMHITIDVNVKVEKALDDFFGDVDQAKEKISKETRSEEQKPEKK